MKLTKRGKSLEEWDLRQDRDWGEREKKRRIIYFCIYKFPLAYFSL